MAPGFAVSDGKGRGYLTALAGTAKGERAVDVPAGPPRVEGGRATVPRVAATPIFGATFGLNFSAWSVAVAGAAIGGVRVANPLSIEAESFSTVRVKRSNFCNNSFAHAGSEVRSVGWGDAFFSGLDWGECD